MKLITLRSIAKPPAKPAEGPTAAKKRRKKRKKVRKEKYCSSIIRVLRQVHPDTSISHRAQRILDSFVNDMFERIATEASQLAAYSNKSTLSTREIESAVRLLMPGELSRYANCEGAKAVARYFPSGAK
ncbi:hypothetical protein AX14_010659 [Amanita brunnescens Koide BX004]|nr:hypothetical protein AX14_011575 [Amanita brunnescens Koide BX004]KAF8720850.1 hypothetical protein AX14_010659 [Amanita brunnescens Koide BX004]